MDAGDGGDQDHGPYPAKHHPLPQVDKGGGRLLTNIKVVTVTFEGDALRDDLRAFDDTIVTTPWWTTVSSAYGVGPGTSGGRVELPDTVSNTTISDLELVDFVQARIMSGAFPGPDTNTAYMLFFPASTTITLQGDRSCDAFDGYHDAVTVTLEGGSLEVPFAVMPRCGQGTAAAIKNALTVTMSHELIELATDPSYIEGAYELLSNDAWNPAGGEVADLCQNFADAISGPYHVTRSWDNTMAAQSHDPCVPAVPNRVYFGAAVDTEIVTVSLPDWDPYQSDGYVTVARGATRDIAVDVFSDAPISGLELAVGSPSSSADPHTLDPILPGVEAKLSATTANNGQRVTLTITVPAGAPQKDVPFVVRALNDTNSADYHDWPVILRIN